MRLAFSPALGTTKRTKKPMTARGERRPVWRLYPDWTWTPRRAVPAGRFVFRPLIHDGNSLLRLRDYGPPKTRSDIRW